MKENLAAVDSRTGNQYVLPIQDGSIEAATLRTIKSGPDDFGLMAFDPGFTNTASCRSAITFIDGDKGILEYRGYPIEQLAERSGFPAVGHLLIKGELPTPPELATWNSRLAADAAVPESVLEIVRRLPVGGHPMSLLQGLVAVYGATQPLSRNFDDGEKNLDLGLRLISVMPGLGAAILRHAKGQEPSASNPELGYVGGFLSSLFGDSPDWRPDPTIERAIDILFILHADHEQNCSTNVVRGCASADADLFSVVAGGIAALSGPLHGGANQAVLEMLKEIGSPKQVPGFVAEVKNHKRKLMGFGHRVYKSYDPRAKIVKKTADSVFAVTGINPLLEIALELERIALEDSYFIERKLYPNVDFYSGLIYEAIGFRADFSTVLFAIARTAGWVAHWLEFLADPDRKIARPRQIYVGPARRDMATN